MPEALVMTKLIFLREVAAKVMVPAPVPEASTAPLSLLTTCQLPIVPPPEALVMTTVETVTAEPHLTETRPVVPLGDQ
nr:hypothetical protein GCM10025732_57120 [Glycomyces mayteni]